MSIVEMRMLQQMTEMIREDKIRNEYTRSSNKSGTNSRKIYREQIEIAWTRFKNGKNRSNTKS